MTDDELDRLEKLAQAATTNPGNPLPHWMDIANAVPALVAEVRRLRAFEALQHRKDVEYDERAEALRLLASFYRSASLSGEALTKTDEEYLADMRAMLAEEGP